MTQQTGRPSYCCYTREETITAGNSRHQMQMTVKLGAMNDGTITAIDLHTLSNAGAYGEHATTTIGLSGHKSLPIYNHVKASRFSWDAVYTNTNRGGAYRGYGATQGQFAVESAVNELADMLHMDPADLRLKNIVREGEIMPQYYNEKLNACALDRCLLRAMDMIGWRDKPLAVDLGDRVRAWAARSPCRARASPTWTSPASTCALRRTASLPSAPAPPITAWASIRFWRRLPPRSWALKAR